MTIRKFGKVGVLFLALVLALASVGAAFAAWTDSLSISGTVETGSVKLCIQEGTITVKDVGPDWTCDPGFSNIRQAPEGKDVGSTSTELTDADGDGCFDTITFVVSNGYPSYYNHIDFWTAYPGTIPVRIHSVVATFDGETKETLYDSGRLTWTDKFELRWGDNFGAQRHAGDDEDNISFDFHLLQEELEQNHQYTLTITMTVVQWNEYVPGPLP